MLPKHHHQQDAKWIAEQLDQLNPQLRQSVCIKYSDVYREIFETSLNRLDNDGEARREANTRLRLFVDRVKGASQGAVSFPPRKIS